MPCELSDMQPVLKAHLINDMDVLNYASFTHIQINGFLDGFDSESHHVEITPVELYGRDTLKLTVVDSTDPSIKLNSIVSFLPCPEECDPRYLQAFFEGKENGFTFNQNNPQAFCISDILAVCSSTLTHRITFHFNLDFNRIACYPLSETSPGKFEGVFNVRSLNAWTV